MIGDTPECKVRQAVPDCFVTAGHWRGEGVALVGARADLGCRKKKNQGSGHQVARPRRTAVRLTTRDSLGRPIVVVTGMGVATSLGAGKKDNWAKLTAGEIRHSHHHAFSHRRHEDHHGGHDRFRAGSSRFPPPTSPRSSPSMAAEEAIAQANIGSKGDFPGPLFLAVAPVEDRMAAAHRAGPRRWRQ